MSAMETQVGGDHYKKLAIQPMQYSMENQLDACQHTIIKYVTRFRDKGGIADLEKAKHVIDMLIEFEVNKTPKVEWVAESVGKKIVAKRKPKAPYGYKEDGTPYQRKPRNWKE